MVRSNQTPILYSVDIVESFPLSTQMKLGQSNINVSFHHWLKFTAFIVIGWGKNGSTEHSKGNKTVPGKVATTRTEDGHK